MPRIEQRISTPELKEKAGLTPINISVPQAPPQDPGTQLSVPGNPSPNRANPPVDPNADIYTTRFFPDTPTFSRALPTIPSQIQATAGQAIGKVLTVESQAVATAPPPPVTPNSPMASSPATSPPPASTTTTPSQTPSPPMTSFHVISSAPGPEAKPATIYYKKTPNPSASTWYKVGTWSSNSTKAGSHLQLKLTSSNGYGGSAVTGLSTLLAGQQNYGAGGNPSNNLSAYWIAQGDNQALSSINIYPNTGNSATATSWDFYMKFPANPGNGIVEAHVPDGTNWNWAMEAATPPTGSFAPAGGTLLHDANGNISTNLNNSVNQYDPNGTARTLGLIGYHTLQHWPDGGGRYAVINGGGMNAVAAVDAANRALIDFAQGGHLNKILDNIGDSSNYNKTPAMNNHENLIYNGSAMVGSNGQTAPGWSENSQIKTGVTLPGGQTGSVIYNVSSANYGGDSMSNIFQMIPGESYYFEFWIETGGAGNWLFYRGNYGDGQLIAMGAPTSWTKFSGTYTVPSNSTELQGQAIFTNAASTSDWAYIWGVKAVLVRNMDTMTMDGQTRVARNIQALPNPSSATWYKIGSWYSAASQAGSHLRLEFMTSNGYAGGSYTGISTLSTTQQNYASGGNPSQNLLAYWIAQGDNAAISAIQIYPQGGNPATALAWDFYVQLPAFPGNGFVEAFVPQGTTWQWSMASGNPPSGSFSPSGGTLLHDANGHIATHLVNGVNQFDPNGTLRSLGLIGYHTLGNWPDGGGRYAVVNGGGLGGLNTGTITNAYLSARPSYGVIQSLSPTYYWPLDNGSMGSLGTRSGSTLTAVGSTGVSGWSVLAPGDAIAGTAAFNGSSAFYVSNGSGTTTWSIGGWVVPGSSAWNNTTGIIGRTSAAPFGTPTNYEPHLFVDTSGYVYAAAWTGSPSIVKSTYALNWSFPHHVAATYNNSTLNLYIDGQWNNSISAPNEIITSESYWTLGTAYSAGWPAPLQNGWNTNNNGINLQDVFIFEGVYLSSPQVLAIYSAGAGSWHTLGSIQDDPTWQKVAGVSGNLVQTGSVQTHAITGSLYTKVTSYVNITTSGTIASISSINLPSNFSYAKVSVNFAIASTNSTALGYGIQLKNAAGTTIMEWGYQSFDSPGGSKYDLTEVSFDDLTGSSAYSFFVSTNSGGTLSLIPVYMTVELNKR